MIFAVHFQGCTKDFHCGLVHSFRTHWHGPFSDLFLPGTKKWKDEKMNEKNNKNEQHSVVVVVVVVFLLNAMEELDKTGKQLLCVCWNQVVWTSLFLPTIFPSISMYLFNTYILFLKIKSNECSKKVSKPMTHGCDRW